MAHPLPPNLGPNLAPPPIGPQFYGAHLLNQQPAQGPRQPAQLLTQEQQAAFGLTGHIGAPASPEDEFYGGIPQQQAGLGTEYAAYAPNDAGRMHRGGASRIDAYLGHPGTPATRPATLAPARRNDEGFANMTTGAHANVALEPRSAARSMRARNLLHVTGLGPAFPWPSRWGSKRQRGDPTGLTDRVLDVTLGRRGYNEAAPGPMQAFRTVTPRPIRELYRAPFDIARDPTRSPVERTVGAAAVGLAGVIVSPVAGLVIAARGAARGLREP